MGKKTKTACCCGGGDLPFLPEDYLIQILVWLPVVSLLRFKSVCKSWLALIQTPFFIDLHTTIATTSNSSSNKFGTFILHALQYHEGATFTELSEFLVLSSESGSRSSSEEEEESEYEYGDWYWGSDGTWHKFTGGGPGGKGDWHWDDTNCGWYWVEADENHQVFTLDDDDDDDDNDQLVLKLDYLGFPPSLDELKFYQVTVGSCNGLICLYEPYDPYPRAISLWNPATRQFRRLPKSLKFSITIEEMRESGDFVLFGFDVKTKDYKVLLITYFSRESFGQQQQQQQLEYSCRAQVYSLSTDSWRLLEGINSLPGIPLIGHYGLYLNNGNCYVVATSSLSEERKPYFNRFIISFDFTKEIFTTKQFPDLDDSQVLFLCCLGGEKMALFTTLRKKTTSSSSSSSSGFEYDGSQDCDIWVLNEHGGGSVNKESWNKLHSFRIKSIISNNLIKLRSISNDGKFALFETKDSEGYERMVLYNLVTKEAKMDFLICHRMSKVYDFKPSLVSIIGGNGAAADAPVIG